jgi:hypothetical protein
MADTSTSIYLRPFNLEGEKRSPALSFAPVIDHFTVAPPLAFTGLHAPDNEAFLSPYCTASRSSPAMVHGRRGPCARTVFGQVCSQKHMLSHAASMRVLDQPTAGGGGTASATDLGDIYEPSGLISFDPDEDVLDDQSREQEQEQQQQQVGEKEEEKAPPDSSLSSMFLDMDLSTRANNTNSTTSSGAGDNASASVSATATTAAPDSISFDTSFAFDPPSSSAGSTAGESAAFGDFGAGGGFDTTPTPATPPTGSTSTGGETSSVDFSFAFDSAASFDPPPAPVPAAPTATVQSESIVSGGKGVSHASAGARAGGVKKPKPVAAAGGKKLGLAPPSPAAAAASSAAAIAKRKKQQAAAAAAAGGGGGGLKVLSPVKKQALATGSAPLPASKHTPPPSPSSGGLNVDDAFISPPIPSTSPPLQHPPAATATPPAATAAPPAAATGSLHCEMDVALHRFEELLCVARKGVVEKCEVCGTLKLSASPLRAPRDCSSPPPGEGVVLSLVVVDQHHHLASLVAAPPSPLCTVTTAAATTAATDTRTTAAVASLPALPAAALPLLSYRAAPAFRPELLRTKAAISLGSDNKTVSVAIQVMLNTKFPTRLENMQVLASFASFVEAGGGAALRDVRSRPASGTYSAASRVLTWECGSHLPASTPLLRMEALLTPGAALLSNPAAMPTSIPIIVKALLSAPLLLDCSIDVSGVSSRDSSSTTTPSSRNIAVELTPVTKVAKSKCEYRFL